MLVIGLVVLPLDAEHGETVLNQGSGHIVLGAERVGGAEHQVCPACLQCEGQVGGLGGDMQAARDADALEGLLLGEALPVSA